MSHGTFENGGRLNEWIENSLCYVILKKRHEKQTTHRDVLYLYRLLAIKFRIEHPMNGQALEVDKALQIILESKICNAVMLYRHLT